MPDVFIPSLAPPDDVLRPYLSWRKLHLFRYRAALGAAASWAGMRPLVPDALPAASERSPVTFRVCKNEQNLPLLFQLLGILRRAHPGEDVLHLSDAIAPGSGDFGKFAASAPAGPAWDDVDGGRRYPLRTFLLCAVMRHLALLGENARVVVPEPRYSECRELLRELRRLLSIGGPSIEIGRPDCRDGHGHWDYISGLDEGFRAGSPGSCHSRIVVGLGIAAPALVYRHMLMMAHGGEGGRRRGPDSGFSALSAIRLAPRVNRPGASTLRTLADIAYAHTPPDFRALVCYEVALQLCHQRTRASLEDAAGWLTKGFQAASAASDAKQIIWETRLKNCDALLSYISGDRKGALRKLRAALRELAAGCLDQRVSAWASCIVLINIARTLQRDAETAAEAIEIWRAVERLGSGPQQEYALGAQVRALLRLGLHDEAIAKAGEYCDRENYISLHLDWELAFRKLYCLAALRTHSLDHPTRHHVARISELEWWCEGGLVG